MTGSGDLEPDLLALQAFVNERFRVEPFNSLRFNLHTNPMKRLKRVAVFVHGWGGGGYRTWHDFIQMTFDGTYSEPMDVAVFDYNSGLQAACAGSSALGADSERLASGIEELERNYSSVHLVCHSLGGLVAGEAIRSSLTHRRLGGQPADTNIAGYYMFASPRAGTGLASPLLSVLIREFRWLKRFSPQCETVERFFTDHVQTHAVAHTLEQQFLIPRFAYLGSADKVVDRFSASFSIPRLQIKHTTGDHRSIVKPTAEDHPQLAWLSQMVSSVENLRKQRERERPYARQKVNPTTSRQVLVTKLWHDPSTGDCADLYNDVRKEASRDGVLVQDRAELLAHDTSIDLLLSVHDASEVNDRTENSHHMVANALTEYQQSSYLTVAITPVGEDHCHATAVVNEWLLPDPPAERFYVEGAADNDALRDLMWKWMQRIIQRDPRRGNRSGSDIESFASQPLPKMDRTGGAEHP